MKISELTALSSFSDAYQIHIAQAAASVRSRLYDVHNFLQPLRYVKTYITSGQVAALYSSPKTLVTGITSRIILPVSISAYTPAGTAYTGGNIALYYSGISTALTETISILTTSTEDLWHGIQFGVTPFASPSGLGLTVKTTAAANPTGGNKVLYIYLIYAII